MNIKETIIRYVDDDDTVIFKRGNDGIKRTKCEIVGSIVRCKDCMLNTLNTDGTNECWCYKFGYAVEDTDYCSYGERIGE